MRSSKFSPFGIPAAAVGQVCGKAWHGGGQCELWRSAEWSRTGMQHGTWEEIDRYAINTKRWWDIHRNKNRCIRGCHACSRSAIWLWEQAGLSFQYIELLKAFPLWNEWTQQFFTKSMKWANYRTSNWCQTIRVDKAGSFVYLFGEPRLWVVTGRITGGFQS